MPSTISIDRTCRLTWEDYLKSMFALLDDNIFDTQRTTTVIYALFYAYSNALQDLFDELEMTRNDCYLYWQINDEAIIKGEPNGLDRCCFFAVAEIISVGDTPGASDYIETVDFERHQLGIQWAVNQYGAYTYGYTYGYGGNVYGWTDDRNPWHPHGRQEPVEGEIFYITYRYGCREANLYNNFGRLVQLVKGNEQTYPEYRKAIKALIVAYLMGPTVAGIRKALSAFTDEDNITIQEGYTTGWYLGESLLYTEDGYNDGSIYQNDGTVLYSEADSYIFDVFVDNSDTVADQTLFTQIVNKLKPAHTIAYVHFN